METNKAGTTSNTNKIENRTLIEKMNQRKSDYLGRSIKLAVSSEANKNVLITQIKYRSFL